MTRSTILKKVRKLQELKYEKASLEEQISKIEEEIQAEMMSTNTYEYESKNWKVTWNLVESTRFDQTSFMQDHPDLFKQYRVPNNYRRFLLFVKKGK